MKSIQTDDYSAWKGWDRIDFGKPSKEQRAYLDAELGPFVSGARVRVLELGFGNGGMLGWCRERGLDCVGVESNQVLVNKAVEAGFNAVGSLAEARIRYGNHAFDLAVAFDVLEHIPVAEIARVMEEIRLLLKPATVLLVSFPNGDSPLGRAYQHGDLTHVTTLGSGKLDMLAMQAGYRIDRLKEPAIPLRGVGILRACKRASAKVLRSAVDQLLSYAYFAGSIHVFSPTIVAVLRTVQPCERDDARRVEIS